MEMDLTGFDYDEYTRYVHNLNCHYLRVNREAEVVALILDHGQWRRGHNLSVYVGGSGQTLDQGEQKALRKLATYCTEQSDAWIVLDLTLDLNLPEVTLPREWVGKMLPFIMKDDEFIRDDFLCSRMDTCVSICSDSSCPRMFVPNCSSCPRAEERLVTSRYNELLSDLVELYSRGSLVHPGEQFISDWELLEDERGIWYPSWQNSLLTVGDPTRYLTYQLRSRSARTYRDAAADLYASYEQTE